MNTYDPKKVIFTFGGYAGHGYSDSTFIEVLRDEDGWSKKVGADGEVTRTRNNNQGGRVRITVQQGSAFNDILSALAAADELTATSVHTLQVTDLNGTSLEHSQNAWIVKYPDAAFAKESGDRVWEFDCDVLSRKVGGLT